MGLGDAIFDKAKGYLGNMITDASGKYHDISKGAFDTYGIKHNGNFDPGFGSLMLDSFTNGVKKLLAGNGVTKEAVKLFGTPEWGGVGTAIATFAGKEAAATATGFAVGGPWGAAIGTMFEIGHELGTYFHGGRAWTTSGSIRRGQWIAIDNGGFGDHEENISLGFYIGPGTETGYEQVYNFETWEEDDKLRKHTLPLPEDFAKRLDDNKVISEVRLLYFAEDQSSRLNTNVCTDPGAEVVFQDEFHQVIESKGKSIFVESKDNPNYQYWVSIVDLKPGRRQHSTSWNYRGEGEEGETAPGTPGEAFQAQGKAAFVSGDWLWVVPSSRTLLKGYSGCKRQLAVMENLDGSHIKYFMAADGEAGRDTFPSKHVRPVADDINEFLYLSHPCQIFRDAAVRGQDTVRLAVGTDRSLLLLTLGITNDVPKAEKDFGEFEWHDFRETEGGTGVSFKEGTFSEGVVKGSTPGEMKAGNKRDAGGAPNDSGKTAGDISDENPGATVTKLGNTRETTQTEQQSNNTLLIVVGAAVVIIGLYFVVR